MCFQLGRTMSDIRAETAETSEPTNERMIIALAPTRDELYDRINTRVDSWFGSKLLGEVQALLDAGVAQDSNVLKALGYRHMLNYLEGKWSRIEAMNRMKIDTRRYAKRQLTWWRSWPNVKWIYRFGKDAEALKEV